MLIKHNFFGKLTTLIIYVDNIIVIRNDEDEMQKLKTYLSNEFLDQGSREYKIFLGIKVTH